MKPATNLVTRVQLEEVEEIQDPSIQEIQQLETEVDIKEVENFFPAKGEVSDYSFYFRIANSYKVLSYEDTIDLAKRISQGDSAAREKMILHNLRLVTFFAYPFKDRGMAWDDLVQEGNIGLMKAVDKFDPSFGCRFSTYARWWIRQSIQRAIMNQVGPVRIPVHTHGLRSAIFNEESRLEKQLGYKPSIEKIAENLGCSIDRAHYVLQGRGCEAFSFDAPMSKDGDGGVYGETFPDSQTVSPYVVLSAQEKLRSTGVEITNLIYSLNSLQKITERQRQIFKAFYRLAGSRDVYINLELTSQEFGITRERVRQVLIKVWNTLKLNFPNLAFDHDSLFQAYRTITVLENATGEKVSIVDQIDESVCDKGLAIKYAGYGRRFSKYVRATPSYVNWKSDNHSVDKKATVLGLVSYAYEVEFSLIMSEDTSKVASWARYLVIYIMINDLGLGQAEVVKYFRLNSASMIEYALKKIETMISQYSLVKEDVEGIRNHFRKIAGL